MLGWPLHIWENVMVGSLLAAAVSAAIVCVATYAVVSLQRQEIAASKAEFEHYRIDAAEKISASQDTGQSCRK
jgi:hypothetical protein